MSFKYVEVNPVEDITLYIHTCLIKNINHLSNLHPNVYSKTIHNHYIKLEVYGNCVKTFAYKTCIVHEKETERFIDLYIYKKSALLTNKPLIELSKTSVSLANAEPMVVLYNILNISLKNIVSNDLNNYLKDSGLIKLYKV